MTEKVEYTRNILITGERQVGKTTLIRNMISSRDMKVAGYQTIPYEIAGVFHGYEMMNLVTKDKQIISQRLENGFFVGIEATFEGFGTQCLQEAIQSSANLIVMDEIGRFERNCENFIRQINKVLDCPKYVMAVIKKEPIPFIEVLKARDDVILLDLDVMSAEGAAQLINNHFDKEKFTC